VVKYLAAVTQDFNLTLETDADCIFLVCVCGEPNYYGCHVICFLEKEHFLFGQVLPNMHNNQAWQ